MRTETDLALVCFGGGSFTDEEQAPFEAAGERRNLISMGGDDRALAAADARATALIYPSLYEGFGMPILEAMINRCPVIIPKRSCFPEIAEDAALYFDTTDPDGLVEILKLLLRDTALRSRLGEAGAAGRWPLVGNVARRSTEVLSKPRRMTTVSVDHAALRGRRIVLSMVTGLPAFGLQVVGGLLVVTLAWRALGADGFGLWSAIIALGPIVALADLGVSNALISFVASAMGRDDGLAVRRVVAMAIVVSMTGALLLTALLVIAYALLDWEAWFNLPPTTPFDAALGVIVYAGCRLLLLPLGVVAKLRTGLQENFVNSAWDAAGVCLSLGLFYIASRTGAGLPILLLASGTGPLLRLRKLAWAGWTHFIPRPSDLDIRELRPLLRLGVLFFALNLPCCCPTPRTIWWQFACLVRPRRRSSPSPTRSSP